MPSTPYDAKGLMKSSIRDDGPVVFIQGRCPVSQSVPEGEWIIPLGKADVKREGSDITVVATSLALHRTLQAADELDGEIGVEVVDPRTLVPLDKELIIESVKRTVHVVIVQEAIRRGGVASDIASIIQEEAFDYLDAPIRRLAGRDIPIPYNRTLERATVPQVEDIVEAARALAQEGR